MNTTERILIACGLGAFIGTMVALQLGHLFWWVGMLVGGFVGYFSYEFKTVVKATKTSFERVYGYTHWKGIGTIFLAYCCSVISFIPVFYGLWYILNNKLGISGNFIHSYVFMLTVMFCFFLIRIAKGEHRNETDLDGSKEWIRAANPISLYLFHIPRGIWWCLRNSPKAIPTIRKFTWHLFVLIHSDIRLLCGTDAAIGSAIGYFCDSPIIGLVAGGVFGIINYEIVSKKWLKLPKPS